MKNQTKLWLSIGTALLLLVLLNRWWAGRVGATYDNCERYCQRRIHGICVDWEWRCITPTPTLRPTATPEPTKVPEPTSTPQPTPDPCDLEYKLGSDEWENPCVTPTPEPTRTPEQPLSPASPGPAPICGNKNLALVPYNFHVWRNGTEALLQWVPTGGDSVNIYYKEVGATGWQHSVINEKNDGYVQIGSLNANLGYEFAVEQKDGCGSGELSPKAVVKDPPSFGWTLFYQTSWE